MSIKTWTYIIVGITFSIYIGIAIWSRVQSTKEFYVADGGVGAWANGMATAADWMSAASFISMAGIISFAGYDGAVYLMGWTGGYVLLAFLLAPYLRKFGKFTVPEFIGDRYYSNNARLVAVFCALLVSFTYVAGQMRGVGIVFSRFLEVDIDIGVIIGMLIVLFYAVLGGMKGITYTQVAQYCVLIFAFMAPAIFISIQMTGNPIPQLGFGSELISEPSTYLLDKLDNLNVELGFNEYTENTKPLIDVFAITLALMVGTAGLPHVIVRFFTVKKVSDARKSAGIALLLIAILYTTAPAVAAFARTNLLETISTKPYSEIPQWFKKWENTGLIKFDDLNNDGMINYSNDYSNELYVDRDIMVLANPEIANLPNWVVALVAAGGLAAALSTAAGLLLVISASVSHDLIKRVYYPEISEKGELIAARISVFFAVCIAGYFGINPPGFVAAVVALAFGLAAASFFPAIVMGIFYKQMNKEGAIAGMLVGISLMVFYMLKFKFNFFGGGSVDDYWFGISPEGFGSVAMVGLILGLIGSGGSILSVPILVYLFGTNPVTATAYSLFIVGTTSLIGSIKNLRNKLINYSTTLLFSFSAVITVYLTRKYLIHLIPETIIDSDLIFLSKNQLIMLLFSLLMLVAGFLMIKRTPKTIVGLKRTKTIAPNKLLIFVEGSLIGFLTGLVGAGGGFMIIPILVILSDLRMKAAIATSLAIISLKSLIGFIGDVQNLRIDWVFLLLFTLISVIGIFIGQLFSQKVPENKLKMVFGLFVIIIGTSILFIELT